MLLRCDELQGCRVRHEPLLQLVAVAHLIEGGALGAVAAHDEVRVREAAAHLGGGGEGMARVLWHG